MGQYCGPEDAAEQKISYVDDETFRKLFADDGVRHVLPESAREAFEALRKTARKYCSEEVEYWDVVAEYLAEYRVKIVDRICDTLRPEFEDETFVVITADDHPPLPTEEDFMQGQFDTLKGFSRVFSNH